MSYEDASTSTNVHFARVDSIDSNATADDLPGPGRVLDKAFQAGGRKIERALNNLVQRITGKDASTSGSLSVVLERVDTTDSEATEANLPGPGRALDNLFRFSGEHVERRLGKLADRMGFGPAAMERRLIRAAECIALQGAYQVGKDGRSRFITFTDERKVKAGKEVRRSCKLLVQYLQYVVVNSFHR